MEVPVAERHNIGYMGTLVRTGRGKGIVVSIGMGTELGKIMALIDNAEDRKSPLQEKMDDLAKRLSAISFGIIAIIFGIGVLYHKGWLDMFTIGVSLAVAAIPEGLPIVVAVTLALGVQRMAARNAVVKKLPAVEALGCASVVCVDKTGTLTRNEMTVVEAFSLVPPPSSSSSSSSSGSNSNDTNVSFASSTSNNVNATQAYNTLHQSLGQGIGSRILFHGLGYNNQGGYAVYATPHQARNNNHSSLSTDSINTIPSNALTSSNSPQLSVLFEAACICNNAHLVTVPNENNTTPMVPKVELMGQPTEGALLTAAMKIQMPHVRDQWVRTHEIPFNSDTKWMAVRARPATAADTAVAGLTPAETLSSTTNGYESIYPSNGSLSSYNSFYPNSSNSILATTATGRGHPNHVTSGSTATGNTYVPGEYYFVKGSVDAILSICDSCVSAPGTPGGNTTHAAILLGANPNVASSFVTSSLPFTVSPLTVSQQASILAAAETMAREGLRVIALAKGDRIANVTRFNGGMIPSSFTDGNNSSISSSGPTNSTTGTISGTSNMGLVFLGLLGLHDPPREGALSTVRTLRDGGVRVCMITGDGEATALAIATQLGLIDEQPSSSSQSSTTNLTSSSSSSSTPSIVTSPSGQLELGAKHEISITPLAGYAISGTEVEAMTEEALSNRLATAVVFYRTTPKHKMKIVHAFQRRGLVVAMTGDGVNDAPALKVADIGVAMGRSGTDVAKEAADMVLIDDNFSTIIGAIEEGKGIFANIRNFVRFQLSTSVAALTLVTACTLLGLPNPLNAMQILWINIIMDGPPAQSLGVEPVDPSIIRKPPRKADEPIITAALLRRVLAAACIIVMGTLYVFVTEAGDGTASSVRRDTTMTFTTFVMFDMFNALSCRSSELSVFSLGLSSNTFFLLAVGGSLLGQLGVIYLPPLQAIFQTEAISFADWLYIVSIASSVMWMEEIIKAYNRAQDTIRSRSNMTDTTLSTSIRSIRSGSSIFSRWFRTVENVLASRSTVYSRIRGGKTDDGESDDDSTSSSSLPLNLENSKMISNNV